MALMLVSVAGCTGSDDPSSGGTVLPNGFVVPSGSSLIGAAIPVLSPAMDPTSRAPTTSHTWQAQLRVHGSPRKVYEAFRAQAKTKHLPLPEAVDRVSGRWIAPA